MLHVTITDRATPAIERMEREAARHLDRSAEQRGDRYQSALREATPEGRGERPGRTKAAWQLSKAGLGAMRLLNAVPWLKYLVQGRGPIVAKPGKVLRFVIDGEVLYRHRVGPAAPNAFIDKTLAYEATHDQRDADELARLIAGEMR
jgi:hypothetical protein